MPFPNVQEGSLSWRILAYFNKRFPPGTLRRPTLKGGVWTLVSLSLTGLLGVGSGIIIARLLTPEVFGIVGIALATVAIWDGLTTTGVWQALIQRSDGVDSYLDTAWTLQVVRGILLFCLTFFGAPWLAAFYNNYELIPLVKVLSFTFLIRGASNLSMVKLNRDMRFRRLALFNQITGMFSICFQLVLVILFRNAWALALAAVSSSLIRCAGSYIVLPRRNRLAWQWDKMLPLLHFGKYIWGSSLVFFLLSWGDRVFIGRMVGEKELGFYIFALSLAYIPAKYTTNIIAYVTYPAYAKIQDRPDRLRTGLQEVVYWTSMAILPYAGLMAVLAPDVITYIYGTKWIQAVPIIRIMLVMGVASAFSAIMYPLFRAVSLPRLDFRMNVSFLMVAAALIVPFAAGYGIIGVALVMSIGALTRVIVGFFYVRAVIGISFTTVFRPLLGHIAGTVIAAAAAWLLRRHVFDASVWWAPVFSLAPAVILYTAAVFGWFLHLRSCKKHGEAQGI